MHRTKAWEDRPRYKWIRNRRYGDLAEVSHLLSRTTHYHTHSPCRPLSCLVLSLTVTAKSVTSLLSRTEDDMEGIKGRQAVEEEEKEAPVMQ